MNRKSLPTLIGVFTSLLAIWFLHSFLIVDDCLDHGGSFDHATATCLIENGQVYESGLAAYSLILYFIVGFVVSFIVSNMIRKVFNIER